MANDDKLYIDGAWVPSTGTGTIDVIDSVTEEVMASVPAGSAADVDAAVAAARAAFDSWSTLPVEERAKYMSRIGDGLAARMDEIATLITRETGMAKWLSQLVQAGLPINSFNQAAAVAESYVYDEEVAVLVDGLISMLEPLMVVVLGLIVGFIVIALFMPLIKLLNDLS